MFVNSPNYWIRCLMPWRILSHHAWAYGGTVTDDETIECLILHFWRKLQCLMPLRILSQHAYAYGVHYHKWWLLAAIITHAFLTGAAEYQAIGVLFSHALMAAPGSTWHLAPILDHQKPQVLIKDRLLLAKLTTNRTVLIEPLQKDRMPWR